jgi:Cation efflux family
MRLDPQPAPTVQRPRATFKKAGGPSAPYRDALAGAAEPHNPGQPPGSDPALPGATSAGRRMRSTARRSPAPTVSQESLMPQPSPPARTSDLPDLPPPAPSAGALAWLRWAIAVLKATTGPNRVAIRRHHAPTGGTESLGTVAIAISTDLAMSVAKAVAAALTGSAGLFAETLHSLADTGNQLLLLKGLRGSRRRPDTSHPFGYGAELFYWSLLAALSIFVVGGVLSIWEGIQRLLHPSGSKQALWVLPCSASAACSTAPPGSPRCASSAGRRPRAASGSGSTCAPPPTPRSRPSSTRTRRRCSATRSPSPGSACTSSSAPRRPMRLPGS